MWSVILRNLWFWVFLVAAVAYIALAAPGPASSRWLYALVAAAMGLALGLVVTWRSAFGLRLVRGFRTIRYGEIELRCPAELADGEAPQWVASWVDELLHLVRRELSLPQLPAPRIWLVRPEWARQAADLADSRTVVLETTPDGTPPSPEAPFVRWQLVHSLLEPATGALGPPLPAAKVAGLEEYVLSRLPDRQGRPRGYPAHRVAASLLALDVLPSIEDLACTERPLGHDRLMREVAFSFTAFLVQDLGWEAYWLLYRGGPGEWPLRAPGSVGLDASELAARWRQQIVATVGVDDAFRARIRAFYRALAYVAEQQYGAALQQLEGLPADGESLSVALLRLQARALAGDTRIEDDAALLEKASLARPHLHLDRRAFRFRLWAALHPGNREAAARVLQEALQRFGAEASLTETLTVGEAAKRLAQGSLEAPALLPHLAARWSEFAGDRLLQAALRAARRSSAEEPAPEGSGAATQEGV